MENSELYEMCPWDKWKEDENHLIVFRLDLLEAIQDMGDRCIKELAEARKKCDSYQAGRAEGRLSILNWIGPCIDEMVDERTIRRILPS